MSLEVEVRARLGAFALDARFAAEGGVTALFGRSGSGKTSVIGAVAGLYRPEAGRIVVDGVPLFDSARGVWVPPHRRRLGVVFQEGRLFPHLTVRANLLYGRWFAGRRAAASLDEVVDLLGIAPLLDRRPGRLSGGERQRVAIGRALLSDPAALLLDEPLAALDEARKAEILPYLERLRDHARVPILYVSHSAAEVARLARTVVMMADGRVERVGPAAALLADPAGFVALDRDDAGAVIEARVAAQEPADGFTRLAAAGGGLWVPAIDAAAGARLRLRIRARDVTLATRRPESVSALNILEGRVAEIGPPRGAGVDLTVACGPDLILARITRRSLAALGLAPGAPVFLMVKSVAVSRGDMGAGDA